MQNIPPYAAVPLALLQHSKEFLSFFNTHRNLLLTGFLSQCPVGDKQVMMSAYVADKAEDAWNKKHEEAAQKASAVFRRSEEAQRLESEDMKAYNSRLFRAVYEAEQKSLDEELKKVYPNTPCGYIQLKNADGSFRDRWSQVFFHPKQEAADGMFEEARAQMAKADDFSLITANICDLDDKSGGRSLFGAFSQAVSSFITVKAKSIRDLHKITATTGTLHTVEKQLKHISAQDRDILIIDIFNSLIADSNLFVSRGELYILSQIVCSESMPTTAKIETVIGKQVEKSFAADERNLIGLIQKTTLQDEYKKGYLSNRADADEHINNFYRGCKGFSCLLSDFLTLMKVHFEKDFVGENQKITTPLTEEPDLELERAVGKLRDMKLSGSSSGLRGRRESPTVSPRSPTLKSPREPTSPRKALATSSSRKFLTSSGTQILKISPRDDQYECQVKYCELFKSTQRVLQAILNGLERG